MEIGKEGFTEYIGGRFSHGGCEPEDAVKDVRSPAGPAT